MGNSRLTEERVDIIYKVAPIIIIITTIIITIIIIIIIIKEKRSFFIRQVHHGFEFVHRSIPFFESQTFPHCINFVLVAPWWALHLHNRCSSKTSVSDSYFIPKKQTIAGY